MPPGLAGKAENLALADLSPQDARSFSSQLIVERFSLSITMQTQSSVPPPEIDPASAMDFSAEATAERIFSFSISLFGVYQSQNPDESAESALANFEQLVQDAIDEGFGEARNILEELGSLDEQTAEFLDETHSILQLLLDKFFTQAPEGESGETQPSGTSLDSYWQTIEIEYQYLSYESLSTSESTGGEGADAGSFSAEYTRFQYESLSLSMSYGESLPESTLQYIA